MSISIDYRNTHYKDRTHHYGEAWSHLALSLTDMNFNEVLYQLAPDKFARALMPEDMRDWLAANVQPSDYSLHMEQERQDEFSFTRRAWIEFSRASDALLFKLTWGSHQ